MKKTLRICLILKGSNTHVGGIEYTTNIILALGSLPLEVRSTFELCLFGDTSAIDASLYKKIEPYLAKVYDPKICLEPATLSNRIRWKVTSSIFQQQYPMYDTFFKKESIDFVYPYFSLTKHKYYRSAALIYDFQHKHLPQFFTPEELEERDKFYSLISHQASAIVLSSKSAESDFNQFFPGAAHKVKVLSFTSLPINTWYEFEPLKIQKKYHLPNKFFLLSNQFWQHKNHLTVFKALKLLREKCIYPIIVCTGSLHDYRQPEYSNKILQVIHEFGIANQVYLLGLIPKLDQIQLMRRSIAVIQPSLFEGWSTLVENARCLGKSLIISNLPVHLEQNPPHSVFFEAESPENLADILAEQWNNLVPGPDLQQEEIAKNNSLINVQNFGYKFLDIAQF